MTPSQLEAVIDAMAEIAAETNDAMEDGDRGRGNKLMALVIAEDGSGQLGQLDPHTKEFTAHYDFTNRWMAVKAFMSEGTEIEAD
jgi:hypothetical protein